MLRRMRRLQTTFAAALLALAGCLAGTAGAAPLDTIGIPASARGVAHVDFETARKTPAGTVLTDLLKKIGGESCYELEACADITVGFIPTGETCALLGIARGKFPAATLREHAKRKKYTEVTIGKTVFYDTDGAAGTGLADDGYYIGCYDENTYVVVEKSGGFAKDVVAALDKSAPSLAIPPALGAYGKKFAATPILLGWLDESCFRPDDQGQARLMGARRPKAVFAAAGVDDTLIKIRIRADYADAKAAEQSRAAVNAMLAFSRMNADAASKAKDASGNPDAAKSATAALVNKVLDRVRIAATGSTLNMGFDYPVADAVKDLAAASPR